ncbi:MAG: hypothetical protein ACREP9_15030, partial [Candidatus Dormibacteraceae bacterium]
MIHERLRLGLIVERCVQKFVSAAYDDAPRHLRLDREFNAAGTQGYALLEGKPDRLRAEGIGPNGIPTDVLAIVK